MRGRDARARGDALAAAVKHSAGHGGQFLRLARVEASGNLLGDDGLRALVDALLELADAADPTRLPPTLALKLARCGVSAAGAGGLARVVRRYSELCDAWVAHAGGDPDVALAKAARAKPRVVLGGADLERRAGARAPGAAPDEADGRRELHEAALSLNKKGILVSTQLRFLADNRRD